ncbi:hypothetical protein V757_02160 [Pelistega indica]|uniref:Uncharacterized protein n=1 Tax=Pelistega indica TaxID=1414851 RepID=V8G8A6_9BURK|nr:hypothetical protein [Pelistega indica]ETD72764.1 hypothetical protein V757_02160 [Pelistega indica]
MANPINTVMLYQGGNPQPQFPACGNTQRWACPLPTQIAGEYDRGSFTLGTVLQPAAIPFQAGNLDGAKAGVSVGLLVVPELHSFTQLFVHVDPDAPAGLGCCGGNSNTMAGVTFEVVGKLIDTVGCDDYASIVDRFEAGEDVTVPDALKNIDASIRGAYHAFLDTATTTSTTTEVPSDDPLRGDTNTTVSTTTVASGAFVPEAKPLF